MFWRLVVQLVLTVTHVVTILVHILHSGCWNWHERRIAVSNYLDATPLIIHALSHHATHGLLRK